MLNDVLKGCRSDRECVAVEYSTEEQEAARQGHPEKGYCEVTPVPPECLAVAYPYQLTEGAKRQVTYFPRPKFREVGPSLFVKRGYKMSPAKES